MNIDKKLIEQLSWKDIPGIIAQYVRLNCFPLILLGISVCLAATRIAGASKLPLWKDWEVCAWGFTTLYTISLYVRGFYSGYWNAIKGAKVALIMTAMFCLLTIFACMLNDYLLLVHRTFTRPGSMLFLFLTAMLFTWLDFMMAKSLASTLPEDSVHFFLSLKFSDVPIAIAFGILALYASYLGDSEIKRRQMDAFFGGAIAFQMMLSNIIWTLTGSVFVEHRNNNNAPKSDK